MKTKVLLMMAICSLIVYSCSTERDEEIKENPTEVKKLELEKLKPLKPGNEGQINKTESDTVKSLLPIASPQSGTDPDLGTDPTPDPNDPELIPPGDIRPPKGGK